MLILLISSQCLIARYIGYSSHKPFIDRIQTIAIVVGKFLMTMTMRNIKLEISRLKPLTLTQYWLENDQIHWSIAIL